MHSPFCVSRSGQRCRYRSHKTGGADLGLGCGYGLGRCCLDSIETEFGTQFAEEALRLDVGSGLFDFEYAALDPDIVELG